MDDLTRINGIGKATAERLVAAGLDSFERLAHDGIAGEHGIRVEWISEAARLHHENTQEKPPRSDDDQGTVDGAPADGGAGDPHTDTSQGNDQGGGGASAAPAGGLKDLNVNALNVDAAIVGPARLLVGDIPEEFRASHPHLVAAFEDWIAAGKADQPVTSIRIASKRPGFRRCNVDHPKAPTIHPADRFSPDELERLLAEPMLTVELV